MGLLSLLSVVILSVYIIFPEKVSHFYFKRCRKLCQGLFFHFAKIFIFSENLSFFCCFFSLFRSHVCRIRSHDCCIRFHDCCIRFHVCHIRSRVCRIRSHDSVVIFLFRMFVPHTLPVGAEALKNATSFKAFALTGRVANFLIPRALPWAVSFCPFRACCLRLLQRKSVHILGFSVTKGSPFYAICDVLVNTCEGRVHALNPLCLSGFRRRCEG